MPLRLTAAACSLAAFIALCPVYSIYADDSIRTPPSPLTKGTVVTELGTVTENVTKLAPVDGPAFLKIVRNGIPKASAIEIVYNLGEAECPNSLSGAFAIKTGDVVEVHGLAVDEDTISTCESADYYIKVKEN